MTDTLPRTTHRALQFDHGTAIGMSHRWQRGQYCSILTKAGIVGCGIYDLKTPAEFDQAIAIARGTPANPLTEPEDLLGAKIVGVTPKAEAYGIRVGMSGREAVERMLQAVPPPVAAAAAGLQVKCIDHNTLVVEDLEARSEEHTSELQSLRQ